MNVRRIRLIHWKPDEVRDHVEKLRSCGFSVDAAPFTGPAEFKKLRDDPPDAVLIDLSRLPSLGRDLGLAIREYKSTRSSALVFVGGDPEKVERIRTLLPDASYASWSRIRSTTKRAIAHRPVAPARQSRMAGYAGTPLPRKLGFKPGSAILLTGAPRDFIESLGALPDGVRFLQEPDSVFDLGIWFVRSRNQLERDVDRQASRLGRASLWIAWPKKGSRLESDLTQALVRAAGLGAGLVDYKVCAIDDTWSGLLFTRRKRF